MFGIGKLRQQMEALERRIQELERSTYIAASAGGELYASSCNSEIAINRVVEFLADTCETKLERASRPRLVIK